MEVEFGWGGVGGGGGGVQSHFHVKPNSVEVVLRLSWGCDKISKYDHINPPKELSSEAVTVKRRSLKYLFNR